ncbi:hypothetical protein GCM10009668_20470 [Nocardioides dubius]|uniref:Uncharacterized protein n=1 Tax=Nocardioides dubius TaxID=317019 RepID=A0ABN1TTN5_9ACTN
MAGVEREYVCNVIQAGRHPAKRTRSPTPGRSPWGSDWAGGRYLVSPGDLARWIADLARHGPSPGELALDSRASEGTAARSKAIHHRADEAFGYLVDHDVEPVQSKRLV